MYPDGNLSALGLGQSEWAANGIPMTRVGTGKWTATIHAASEDLSPGTATLPTAPGNPQVPGVGLVGPDRLNKT